jgi:tetratricopeptide (TPR) repeat protein
VLTLQAAARAGIKPDQEDVKAAGIGRGIGNKGHESSIARFETLDLGGEKIRNARLFISEVDISSIGDMLLGADFFLSHRIFISTTQSKIYFTYNGGRVFDLGTAEKPNQIVAAGATAQADATKASAASTEELRDPLAPQDAAGFRRRGAAFAGRLEFASAIADFDQAIKLDPDDAESYYQRGMSNLQSRQGKLALSDFDETLKRKPDHVLALLERGGIRLAMHNESDARADFDAATRLSSYDPGVPLRVAQIYAQNRQFEEAVVRLDQWIAKYPKDDRLVSALIGRCRVRMSAGKELDLALQDCDAGLKKGGRSTEGLDSRGQVYLRRGDVDKAISDFKASIKLQPRNATALYGLGVAELKKGSKAEGDKNIQAALAISPTVAASYARLNLVP